MSASEDNWMDFNGRIKIIYLFYLSNFIIQSKHRKVSVKFKEHFEAIKIYRNKKQSMTIYTAK